MNNIYNMRHLLLSFILPISIITHSSWAMGDKTEELYKFFDQTQMLHHQLFQIEDLAHKITTDTSTITAVHTLIKNKEDYADYAKQLLNLQQILESSTQEIEKSKRITLSSIHFKPLIKQSESVPVCDSLEKVACHTTLLKNSIANITPAIQTLEKSAESTLFFLFQQIFYDLHTLYSDMSEFPYDDEEYALTNEDVDTPEKMIYRTNYDYTRTRVYQAEFQWTYQTFIEIFRKHLTRFSSFDAGKNLRTGSTIYMDARTKFDTLKKLLHDHTVRAEQELAEELIELTQTMHVACYSALPQKDADAAKRQFLLINASIEHCQEHITATSKLHENFSDAQKFPLITPSFIELLANTIEKFEEYSKQLHERKAVFTKRFPNFIYSKEAAQKLISSCNGDETYIKNARAAITKKYKAITNPVKAPLLLPSPPSEEPSARPDSKPIYPHSPCKKILEILPASQAFALAREYLIHPSKKVKTITWISPHTGPQVSHMILLSSGAKYLPISRKDKKNSQKTLQACPLLNIEKANIPGEFNFEFTHSDKPSLWYTAKNSDYYVFDEEKDAQRVYLLERILGISETSALASLPAPHASDAQIKP